MKYDNSIDRVNEFFSCEGNQFEDLYDPIVQKDGSVLLVVTGKKDIQQEIQSYAEQTDMAYVLRMMSAGVYPERNDLMYGDFTEAPEDLLDAMQMMLNAEKAFYALDLDTRNKFDNDFQKWLVAANTDFGSFSERMGFKNEKETPADPDPEGKES